LRSEDEVEEGLRGCWLEKEIKGSIMGKFEDGASRMMLGKKKMEVKMKKKEKHHQKMDYADQQQKEK
jgi:hypothetical protein